MKRSSSNNIISKIGVAVGFLGLLMGIIGVVMFTGTGNNISPFISEIGKFCFMYCFPTFILGILLSLYPNKK